MLLQESICRSFPLHTGCVVGTICDTFTAMHLDLRVDLTPRYLCFHICVTLRALNFGVPRKADAAQIRGLRMDFVLLPLGCVTWEPSSAVSAVLGQNGSPRIHW